MTIAFPAPEKEIPFSVAWLAVTPVILPGERKYGSGSGILSKVIVPESVAPVLHEFISIIRV